MTRSPKETFLVSGKAKEHLETVAKDSFQMACDYSLLQLRAELPPNTFPSMATDVMIGFDANAQMVGASRVLEILKSLSDPIKPPTPPKKERLNYE